ncbi:hypothetical protein [Tropicimonas aquimaris]|uniref:Glycine zipper domain-containing protein n=1 Tax=Tropicimonas aquimaris TaxID=914152 RepID=A0ABW3ILW0_9RHOB
MVRYRYFIGVVALCMLSSEAFAGACDYRPSYLLGDRGSDVAIGGAAAVGATGGAATAAGFYTLVHASSGLTMLGSTMAGTSAAGTVGIIGGTAGATGTAAAIVLNPVVWVPALAVGLGGAGLEGVCAYLVDERITDYEQVLEIMRDFKAHSDPRYFDLQEGTLNPFIVLTDEKDEKKTYRVEKLYIVNGLLLHRDLGRNTKLGRVLYVSDPNEDESSTAQN